MELTANEYIYKIDSLIETALYNYETEVLSEAAGEAVDKEGKLAGLKRVVTTAFNRLWKLIKDLIEKVQRKIDKYLISRKTVTLNSTIKINVDALNYNPAYSRILSKIANKHVKQDDINDGNQELNELGTKVTEVSGDVTSDMMRKINRALNTYKKLADTALNKEAEFVAMLDIMQKEGKDTSVVGNAKDVIIKLGAKVQDIIKSADMLVSVVGAKHAQQYIDKKTEEREARAKKHVAKEQKAAAKQAKKEAKDTPETQQESADLVSDLLRRAKALLEGSDDSYISTDGATQRDIDDIPEETPVADDKYPAGDVTGGEGKAPTEEEIKDLVGDDKEALAILKDDDGSAITESVIIQF